MIQQQALARGDRQFWPLGLGIALDAIASAQLHCGEHAKGPLDDVLLSRNPQSDLLLIVLAGVQIVHWAVGCQHCGPGCFFHPFADLLGRLTEILSGKTMSHK